MICLVLGITDLGILNFWLVSETNQPSNENPISVAPPNQDSGLTKAPIIPDADVPHESSNDKTNGDLTIPIKPISNDNSGEEDNKQIAAAVPYNLAELPPPISLEAVILFTTNQNSLSSKSRQTLEKIIAYLKKSPETRIRVEGYTDSRGSKDYNYSLSKRRVKTIVSFFLEHGIAVNRIESASYGQYRLNNCGNNYTVCAKNRRVEIWLIGEN
ncbi:protein containing Outer membrane protein, OmpA/MotB [Candidatus Thiomargarita nelsonii]|uniref:Protein containing Outer membrane protein, OmpA/MotB n=1 Tax=Candidatus Thiomargarita nelsonii TaxID=1003181 RepID=A0A0A6NYU5_9GAMM|nr:protein containing Outer membrane protein, OmpA/MotB [Candidatus Thiomargarita nelsonii]